MLIFRADTTFAAKLMASNLEKEGYISIQKPFSTANIINFTRKAQPLFRPTTAGQLARYFETYQDVNPFSVLSQFDFKQHNAKVAYFTYDKDQGYRLVPKENLNPL